MTAVRRHLQQRPVRLLRIDASRLVHHPRFAKQLAREELQVEACLSEQEVGHRLVEIDGDQYTIALRLYVDGVIHVIVRIDHRIETRHVTRRVGVAERRRDTPVLHLPT